MVDSNSKSQQNSQITNATSDRDAAQQCQQAFADRRLQISLHRYWLLKKTGGRRIISMDNKHCCFHVVATQCSV